MGRASCGFPRHRNSGEEPGFTGGHNGKEWGLLVPPPARPHCPLLQELARDSRSCPGNLGAQGTRPGFVLISSLPLPCPMVLCSLWLRCCCTFPSQTTPFLPPSEGSPALVLCTWASLQGLGSQPSPAPNTGICSCPSLCWWTAEGAPRGTVPSLDPRCCSFFPGRGNPATSPSHHELTQWKFGPLV